jgi:hypothetical protein
MLEVISPEVKNIIVPDIFINSVEIESDKVNIQYYLQDSINEATSRPFWIEDSEVLNSLRANIVYDGSSSAIPLANLKKSNLHLIGNAIFPLSNLSASYVSASVYNQNISGTLIVEPVLSGGLPVDVVYNNNTYENVAKVKDLRLLSNDWVIPSSSVSSTDIFSDLYVSYTLNKKAKAGFVFDLDKYLTSKSVNYNLLKNYSKFAKFARDRSSISVEKSSFFIKQSGKLETDYVDLQINPRILKISDNGSKYLVDFTIDNLADFKYDLKAALWVEDFSRTFFDDYILERLDTFKQVLVEYKNKLNQLSANKDITDYNEYYFKYEYDKERQYINSAGLTIENEKLYNIYSDIALELYELSFIFTENTNDKKLLKLLCSMLHPLTTNPGLLGRLLDYMAGLERLARQFAIVDSFLPQNIQKAKSLTNIITKEYKNSIDMNYDYGHGYEVFVVDSPELRLSDITTGFYTQSGQASIGARTTLETSKYLSNSSAATRSRLGTYSISRVDIGKKTYNLLDDKDLSISSINDMYVFLKDYSNRYTESPSIVEIDYSFVYGFDKLSNEFLQLSAEGISIENLSNRPNSSKNNLFKNTVFDPNADSKQLSLKYIADTGINSLYFGLQPIGYTPPPTGSSMHYSSSTGLISEGPKFIVNDQILKNKETAYRASVYYMTLFTNLEIEGNASSNIVFYSTNPISLDQTFDNLRQLNKYFVIINKAAATINYLSPLPSIQKDLLLNIKPELYNRSIQSESKVLISVEDI